MRFDLPFIDDFILLIIDVNFKESIGLHLNSNLNVNLSSIRDHEIQFKKKTKTKLILGSKKEMF